MLLLSFAVGRALHETLLLLSWLVGLGWVWFVLLSLRKLPLVPDLQGAQYGEVGNPAQSTPAAALPTVCAVVPACNEEAAIAATLRSLAALEGVAIEIIAVDDRSTDATGAIMDAVTADFPEGTPLRVIHVEALPAGWLGKPHAMALAARQTSAEWLLFTDGDIVFRQDSLARAMRFMAAERADHLVLIPTMIFERPGEQVMMSCFHAISVWGARPWKIADPTSPRDSIGIGAFNLVRREVYAAVGGYESLRMEVLDDVRLGYKIKKAGYRQRVAVGRGLIRLHWADGASGVVRNLTKNIFAALRYRAWMALAACAGLAAICLLPLSVWLLSGAQFRSWTAWGPLLLQAVALWLISRYYQRNNGIHPAYVATFPVGACLILFAVLRSMAVTLSQGGVRWRGTFYPLTELRKHTGPIR